MNILQEDIKQTQAGPYGSLYIHNIGENQVDWLVLVEATAETFYITIIAMIGTLILGLLLGLLLYLTSPDGLWKHKKIHFTIAALPALIISATPFYGRLVEIPFKVKTTKSFALRLTIIKSD